MVDRDTLYAIQAMMAYIMQFNLQEIIRVEFSHEYEEYVHGMPAQYLKDHGHNDKMHAVSQNVRYNSLTYQPIYIRIAQIIHICLMHEASIYYCNMTHRSTVCTDGICAGIRKM